jgi:hypothetical protein
MEDLTFPPHDLTNRSSHLCVDGRSLFSLDQGFGFAFPTIGANAALFRLGDEIEKFADSHAGL